MNIPTKKLNNGFEMPVYGLGTYSMAESGRDEEDIRAIQAAVESGITHIDTAESYADGECEKLIGRAIANYDRAKLFLVSKVFAGNLSNAGIKRAILGSLQRMKTDYLDLYLMHRTPREERFEECVKAMNELVDEGLVRHIGLSNSNAEHSADLQKLSKYPFVVNQSHYNLHFREPEQDGLLNYCQEHDMLLMGWRPVNKGAKNKNGSNLTQSGIALLDEVCKKYSKTPSQIAINWLISQKNVITLSKTTSLEHLQENLGALDWTMEPEDVEKLRNEFPGQESFSDTVHLA